MTDLDLEARYSVDGYAGIAFYLLGYGEEHVCFDDLEEAPWHETVEDRSRVRAVMVGDDRTHSVDVDDLTALDDLAYCAECGQIGCAHDGREREI